PPPRERVAAPWSYLPSNQGRHAGLGHAVPRPRPILTRREKKYSVLYRQIGMAPPPSGRALRVACEMADMLRKAPVRPPPPPATKTSCLTEPHRCRVIASAEPKPFPPPA